MEDLSGNVQPRTDLHQSHEIVMVLGAGGEHATLPPLSPVRNRGHTTPVTSGNVETSNSPCAACCAD